MAELSAHVCGERYGFYSCGLPDGHSGDHATVIEGGTDLHWAAASLPPAPPTLSDEDMTAEEKTLVRLRAENESLRAEVAHLRVVYNSPCRACGHPFGRHVPEDEVAPGDFYGCSMSAHEIGEDCECTEFRAARSSAAGEDTDG